MVREAAEEVKEEQEEEKDEMRSEVRRGWTHLGRDPGCQQISSV